MTFMAIKAAILAVALALGCAGGPDEFELGYGHIWTGDSSLEGWNIANDDSDMVTLGFVWKLRPTEVIVRSPYGVRTEPGSPAFNSLGILQDVSEEVTSHEEIEDHIVQDLTDAVHTFNEIDWLTRILLLVAVCWLGWVYRERLGRLIPGGNGKSKKS
jgi:hypothetical protein